MEMDTDAMAALPLLELLVLDDGALPTALNCAGDEGWGPVLLFLLEADRLRFPVVPPPPTTTHGDEEEATTTRNVERLLDAYAGALAQHGLLPARDAASLAWLAGRGFPLRAAWAGACEAAWWGVAWPRCRQWPGRVAVQRQVLGGDDCPESAYPLAAVLASPALLRPHLARFLRARCAHALPAYECWVAVRGALVRLDPLKARGGDGQPGAAPVGVYDDPPAALALLLSEARALARRLAAAPPGTSPTGDDSPVPAAGAVSESLRLEMSAALHETSAVGPAADAAALDPTYAAAHCARLERLLVAAEGEALQRLQVRSPCACYTVSPLPCF